MARLFASAYDPHPPDTGALLANPDEECHTAQEFKEDCDINRIMAKYQRSGVAPGNAGIPMYGDFSTVPDFMEAQDILLRARAQFDSLPSALRARFGNDPAQLLAFVQDDANLEEARKLGLLKPEVPAPPPPTPMEVVIVSGNFPADKVKPA